MGKSLQEKLLQKLSVTEHERLEVEAVRKKNTPRPKREIWREFRRDFSYGLGRDSRIFANVAGFLLLGLLCAKVSTVLFVLWLVALCFAIIYGVYAICRFFYIIISMMYAFLAFKSSK